MPVSKSDPPAEITKPVKPTQAFYVRLRRAGANEELGLARFYHNKTKKLYKRSGIYKVDKATRQALLQTGKFEPIMEEDLESFKADAKKPRGTDLSTHLRAKRRAQVLARRGAQPAVEDDVSPVEEVTGALSAPEV